MNCKLFCYKQGIVKFFLAINILMLVWYIFYGYKTQFHSDSASVFLLAIETIKTHHYFVRDWNYANGDIMVFFNNTFSIPSIFIVGKKYLAFSLSRIIPSFLVLSGSYLLSTLITKNKWISLTLVAIIIGGISPWLAENLFGQISYGATFYILCFLLFFTWKYLEDTASLVNFWLIGVAGIVFFVFWSNPSRALVTYIAPLVAALVTTFYLTHQEQELASPRKLIYLACFVFSFALLGGFSYVHVVKNLNPPIGYVNLKWLSFQQMLTNISYTIQGILTMFGSIPNQGILTTLGSAPKVDEAVISIPGLYEALRLVMGCMLLFVLPYSVYKGFFHVRKSVVFVTAFATYSFFIALFFQLATSLPDMTYPMLSSRYLVTPILLILTIYICTCFSFVLEKNRLNTLISYFVIAILLSSGYNALVSQNINFDKGRLLPQVNVNPSDRLANFLLQNDLHYGYATYWNAGVTTVLSDSNVIVRPIGFSNGLPMPFRWLSADSWYEPTAWLGKTFIAVNKSEESQFDLLKVERKLHQMPTQTLTFEGMHIYVFNDNAFTNLQGWSLQFNSEHIFPVDEDIAKQVGHIYRNLQNNSQEIIAGKGEAGYLHYGPYVSVAPGAYQIHFNIELTHADANSVLLDVSANEGKEILGKLELPNKQANTTIVIKLTKREVLEFRVLSRGTADVIFKGVTLKKQMD